MLRLLGLTGLGFVVFSWKVLRERALKPLLFLSINVLFPLYFVHHFPVGWADAVAGSGPWYMLAFFLACALSFVAQFWLGKAMLARGLKTEQPKQFLLLMAIHNAGFIPLPILSSFAPQSVMVYMFFYVLAFNVLFWAFAPSYVASSSRSAEQEKTRVARFRLNPPLVGIALGLILAMTDLYRFVPTVLQGVFEFGGNLSLDLVLVLLGALLADIPREKLSFRKEFAPLVGVKMILWPAFFLLIMGFVPLPGMDEEAASAVRIAAVLEAAVPPATNIVVVSKAYGSEDQLHYAGSAILTTYAASAVTLPLMLLAAFMAF